MAERTPRNLISEAFAIKAASIEELKKRTEAQTRVPELVEVIDGLVVDADKRPVFNLEQNEFQKSKQFLIPSIVPDEEEILVTVGSRFFESRMGFVKGHTFFVQIEGLQEILEIKGERAHLMSTARNRRQFDMHTPIGTNLDIGPVWRRQINMSDFESYKEVLDRLKLPDVTIKTSEPK